MKRFIYIIAVCIGLLSTCTLPAQTRQPSCAVFDFQYQAESSAAEADAFANLISVELARTAKYSVVPRHIMSQTLKESRFNPKGYRNQASAAFAAAKILGVDFVVFGTISRQGAKNEANAFILSAEVAKVTQGARVVLQGDPSAFKTSSAGPIARKLAGISSSAPQAAKAPAAPTAPAGIAAAPVVIQPSQAKPAAVTQTSTAAAGLSSGGVSQMTGKFSEQLQYHFGQFQAATKGRLETGIRYRKQDLDKETDDSFLGTINTLDVENDGIPAELFAAWYFHENFGAELSWFNLRARTVTNPEGFSDGAIVISGPTFAVTGRLTQFRPWTPFASIGLGLFSSEFDHAAWWAKGYESEEIYIELGSPDAVIKNRRMQMKDTTGRFMMFGINYAASENWSFELAYRIMALEVDDHYTITDPDGTTRDRGTKPIPLDNTSIMVGARYSF